MRIISGKKKGCNLFPPKNNLIRPTIDRIKETIFNVIMNYLDFNFCHALDLFSGSGALGIEVVSRGGQCVFVDKDISLTKKNLKKIGFEARVLEMDYKKALSILSKEQQKFDLILLDPPYAFEEDVLKFICACDILNIQSVVVYEHEKDIFVPSQLLEDKRKYGRTFVSYLKNR